MGGLIFFIAPILAFDAWLVCTTGRRQWLQWRGQPSRLAGAAAAGVLLAALCAFVVRFNYDAQTTVHGFPVPFAYFQPQAGSLADTTPSGPLPWLARVTDALTGLVAPLIPFKAAEFLRTVKKELE